MRGAAWPTLAVALLWGLLPQLMLARDSLACGPTHQQDLAASLRETVRTMFYHGYDNYMAHAYPRDELCPLSCTGRDTWGPFALTLVDTLDTLVVLGNYSEFARAAQMVARRLDFDIDRNVSVFETNIRMLGGLLSAHLLAAQLTSGGDNKADDMGPGPSPLPTVAGWDYQGELLRLAVDLADRLLPAFDTPTGIPYGTVNLRHGVPRAETVITSLAGGGTHIVEFGLLSRLTRDPKYEMAAKGAMRALWALRSDIGLPGNHIDIESGYWTLKDASIGPNADSWYEYLLKGYVLLDEPEYISMFQDTYRAVNRYMKHQHWYIDVNMVTGNPSIPWFTALGAFWPGLQVGRQLPACELVAARSGLSCQSMTPVFQSRQLFNN